MIARDSFAQARFASPEYYGDDSVVICPSCGSTNLHPYHVSVYGYSQGAATHVGSGAYYSAREEQLPNPGDGVGTRFWCECCVNLVELLLIFHKGTTFAEWRSCGPWRDQ